MVVFPNSKINVGLNVINKRSDGFHNIETIFYPILWQEALEIIEVIDTDKPFELLQSGISIDAKPEDNLIYKTWLLIKDTKNSTYTSAFAQKYTNGGAGLGGGSADAAFFINMINSKYNLNFTETEKLNIASKIGSDCAFFIKNKPVFAQGKGNEFEDINLDLSKYYILIIYPNIHSNTKEAYEGLTPKTATYNLKSIIETKPIEEWKHFVTNDFEETLFKKYPAIKEVKDLLYTNNALYASMSGSGSAVFGIFKLEPMIDFPKDYKSFLQIPTRNI